MFVTVAAYLDARPKTQDTSGSTNLVEYSKAETNMLSAIALRRIATRNCLSHTPTTANTPAEEAEASSASPFQLVMIISNRTTTTAAPKDRKALGPLCLP